MVETLGQVLKHISTWGFHSVQQNTAEQLATTVKDPIHTHTHLEDFLSLSVK